MFGISKPFKAPLSYIEQFQTHHWLSWGAQWLSSGSMLDLRPKGRGFETHKSHCVVSLSKTH